MKVVVLGAGVVGVSTAWFLAKAGHEVIVIDRQTQAGIETSYANGGQISVSQSEPWANPGTPMRALKWMSKEDAPLLFRWRFDSRQWSWALKFLTECRPGRAKQNIRQLLNLGLYSRRTLQDLRAETGIHYDEQTRGILAIYQSQQALDEAANTCLLMQTYGMDRKVVTRDQIVEIEPALRHIAPKLAGGTYCPSDESGDARMFTQRLALLCEAEGVEFRYHTRINALLTRGSHLSGVSITGSDGQYETLTADAFVMAMGSYSPLLARTIGINLPIYPAKGYSATVPIEEPEVEVQNGEFVEGDNAPMVSITDEENRLVFSRLGDRLRIAGTAEFNGYSTELNAVRCTALINRAKQLFPSGADYSNAMFWTGLRPVTPSNVPMIGRTKEYNNLFLNTGHGALGWTQGPGSGRALADIINGDRPEVDFRFMGL